MTERAGPRGGSRVFATTRSSSADLSIDQVVEQNVNLIKLERYLAAVYGVRQLSCRASS